MNSTDLAKLFRAQSESAPHQILLDDHSLQRDGLNALITKNLLVTSGQLLLVVDPAQIPTTPPADGFTLDATVPTGTLAFLNLPGRDCTIQFIVGTQVDVVLKIQTRNVGNQTADWMPSTSFSELDGLPYNFLDYSDPVLTFASVASTNTQVGLGMNAGLRLTGLLAYIQTIINGNETTVYALSGSLNRDDKGNLSFSQKADLNVAALSLGGIVTMDDLNMGMAFSEVPVENENRTTSLVQLFLGAKVTFENSSGTKLPLEVRVLIPYASGMPVLSLMVLPVPGFETSLDRLGSLIGGETWDAFFSGPAAPLLPYFQEFGLTGYSATFSPQNLSVLSSTLCVGTLKPWTMWGDYTLTLSASWSIYFSKPATSLITLSSNFDFKTFQFLVSVTLPDLTITGRQSGGPVTLTLSQLNSLFDNGLTIPDDLLVVSVGNFSIVIGVSTKQFVVGAYVTASVSLFGTQLLAIEGMNVEVSIDASQPKLGYTATLNGIVKLGPIAIQTNATLSNQTDTVFSLHLVNETLGSMLNHLVHLIDPTYDVSFGEPWNKILDISLDTLVLKVNVTKGIVTLTYTLPNPLDLIFVKIVSFGISYTKGTTNASKTKIEIEGSFFGQQFGGGGSNPPLSWDPVNENPPAVPGGSPSVFDLQYAGLGQHIAFAGGELKTVGEVMKALKESVLPSPSGALPPFGQNGLAFSSESNWLVGAQFTVADTVSISAIFNDPNLYGILIQLSGAKAKFFAGLSFEILYRKVTDTIGVYHIELKLPDAMRNLQFGAVSITLPVVILDIYTNGNFRVDFGFPNGLDFSASFSIQIFPFVGFGGFYFALLDGATSTRVPKITNGTFSPVIEFGFALSVGVGKTVNAGILSGGITVTVIGVVQGVLGWFNPTDNSPKEVYYWIQGTISIVGRLYATIDFAIIQASLDVTAYASVTLTIESYQPIYIAINAGVSVRVSVKIIFFTIHLSFQATVSASFTIGSASPTPWKIAAGNTSSSNAQLRMLCGQQTRHTPRPHRAGYLRALRMALDESLPITSWPAVTVLPGGIQDVRIWGMPAFTKSSTAGKGEAILILAAENSIAPNAGTIQEHRTLHGSDPASAPFNLLMQGMLGWAIHVITNGGTSVTADQLAALQIQLKDPETIQAAFDYTTLTNFLAKNFKFDITPTTSVAADAGVAIFPMIPAISLSDTSGVKVDFASFNGVDSVYQEKVEAYFQLLQTQFDERNKDSNSLQDAVEETPVSMATIVFARYFNMLMTGGVKAASDLLESYPFTTSADVPMSIAEIGTEIGDATLTLEPLRIVAPNQDKTVLNAGTIISLPDVVYQIRSGETLAGIASVLTGLGAQNEKQQAYTATDLLEANLDSIGLFIVGTGLPISGISYTTQANDTLNLISGRILLRANGSQVLNQISYAESVEKLLQLNPSIADPNRPINSGLTIVLDGGMSYTTVSGDTLTLIAACFIGIDQGIFNLVQFIPELVKLNSTLKVVDPTLPQPIGTVITLPNVTRLIASGDTVNSLAVTLITTVSVVQNNILAIPESTPLLATQGILAVPLQYAITAEDTFGKIATKFDVTLQYLADQLSAGGTAAKVFGKAQDIVVSDLESIQVSTLMNDLLNQTEWNNASGQVSRFLLSGLRLPDPNDAYFQNLTIDELYDPTKLGPIVTAPMFALTGQQYPINAPAPSGYQITLTNQANAPWVTFDSASSIVFGLTDEQEKLLEKIANTPLTPEIETLTRLALYKMVPPRVAILNHVAWQAAVLPVIDKKGGEPVGNPSIWLFPDDLILMLDRGIAANYEASLLYELVLAKETGSNSTDTSQVSSYAWGTIVDISVSLPVTDGPAPSIANTCVIDGADDTGAALLQQIFSYLTGPLGKNDNASIFLLYSPNPTARNPGGMISDALAPDTTYLLKTNLSTLTHSANTVLLEGSMQSGDPTEVYSAPIANVPDFLALLWEASITRSGGFFLNYTNANGGTGLPASVFGTESSATISVLILLDSQLETKDAPILPFNNCGVSGVNIDTSSSSVFAQPATYTVLEGDSLTTVQTNFNATWGTKFAVLDVAALNQDVPLLLKGGANMTIPGQSAPYEIGYGDTLSGIVAKFKLPDLQTLLTAGSNAADQILETGGQMQFANNVLQRATTVSQGNVGFEITRKCPDSENVSYKDLTPQQIVGTLFNLVGFNIAEAGVFVKSGAGLPTTPAESLQDGTDGLTSRTLDAELGADWFYRQTIVVSQFSTVQNGSASAALPAALTNPYNGVGYDEAKSIINRVTVDLDLQDIYGNVQNLAAPFDTLSVPVGYYDNVINPSSWPSLAMSYSVTGSPVTISLSMTMQQTRYIPGVSVSVTSAMAAIAADLKSYRNVYYQLIQPDIYFSLQTSLDADSLSSPKPKYPLSKNPFLSFAYGAYIYLNALSTMKQVGVSIRGASTTISDLANDYGVTGAQLLSENQNQRYSILFGTNVIQVPAMYMAVDSDTLASIVANPKWSSYKLTVADLAMANKNLSLNAGTDLVTPKRTANALITDSLNKFAVGAQASVEAVARANASRTDILNEGILFTVGTKSYKLGENDSFEKAAENLNATVDAVATANQWLEGIFVKGVSLDIADVLVSDGDTLASLAATYNQNDVGGFALMNETVSTVFAPGTPILIGTNLSPSSPAPEDTLLTFAQRNDVTVDQLGSFNAGTGTVFADGGTVLIPGILSNDSTSQFATYSAKSDDDLNGIATRFSSTADGIAMLNPDIPGLLAAEQKITDSTSGKSVQTVAGDTFNSIVQRFKEIQVTVSIQQLAEDTATQAGLVIPQSLWITPSMLGGANGKNPDLTLTGLAAAYNTDVNTIATANGATRGFLADGVVISLNGVSITTNKNETLNSIVNRLAVQRISTNVIELANALSAVKGLMAETGMVTPIPPPPPALNFTQIDTKFSDAVFQINVNVVLARDSHWIDPDFASVPSVLSASCGIPPSPDPENDNASFSLTQFARNLQNSISGLHVATGASVAEGDAANAGTIWGVNFGSAAGPKISYQFDGTKAAYFAIPPLSTALMGGKVNVIPYVPGQSPPFTGTPTGQTFQSIDLDVWLNSFLSAVDEFLSPAYVTPAFSLSPKSVVHVIEQKRELAEVVSKRLALVLDSQIIGSQEDAFDTIYQALLVKLSNAFSVNTVVQLPVSVASESQDEKSAPRLSGKLIFNPEPGTSPGSGSIPSAFSFSTAKVSMTNPASNATFLFSVKAPSEHKQANLDLSYVVNELEIPDPGAVIGDYEGSYWLSFLIPLDDSSSVIGPVSIPIPLRSYPSPVTLAAQTAEQSVNDPQSAGDLIGWDLGFIYRHDDAQQDTPFVAVSFNSTQDSKQLAIRAGGLDLDAIFQALAQFSAVYPTLVNDLAVLPNVTPGTTNANLSAAVEAFAWLVNNVVTAWRGSPELASFNPPKETYYYQMQKQETKETNSQLSTLTITSFDPVANKTTPNPVIIWPDVYVTVNGQEKQLQRIGDPSDTEINYQYPPGIPASTELTQRFVFEWPGTLPGRATHYRMSDSASTGASQVFQFNGTNILLRQNGKAGVLVSRNLSLIPNVATNPAFIYQTPLTNFTSVAIPSVVGRTSINIGSGVERGIAQALGSFLESLFTSLCQIPRGETITIRFGASYSFALATTMASAYGTAVQTLNPAVPILLIPSFDFDPNSDWNPSVDESFVAQVESIIDDWQKLNSPATDGASYLFNLTLYASQGQLQPLIQVSLKYLLTS